MPRRSIIQQYLEENDKKVGKYSQAIDAYNAENRAKTDAYNAKAADFNAFMDQVKKGQNYAVADIGTGNMLGYDPSNSWPEGKVPVPFTDEQAAQRDTYNAYVSQKQQELNTQWQQNNANYQGEGYREGYSPTPPVYDPISDPNAPTLPQTTYVDKTSPEGQEILRNQPAGQFAVVTGKNNEAGDLKYVNTDKRGLATDAGFMGVELPATQAMVSQGWGGSANRQENFWLRNGDGTATMYSRSGADKPWIPTGATARIAEWKEAPPTAAAMPEQPKFNTLSLREEDELKSPTLDQPGANLAAAHNLPAKTGLVNQMSSGTSAFAERDQQKNIAESGILARVLAGQVK